MSTPEEYVAGLDQPRRTELGELHDLIRRTVPALEPTMEFGMPGYGRFHYRYASGREGDTVLISMASRKNYISVYVTALAPDGGYLPESYQDRLPKADIGKSCIRFKRLSDVDQAVLAEIFLAAAEQGGAGAA
ncbi:DUF1801 domain-containing protein [Longispora sp. NPDC051575]|uniref:iron chaperone n=1 Tax=Longispora sp. NPDC051575 TaxID=3154943 RepID=UPI00342FCDF8